MFPSFLVYYLRTSHSHPIPCKTSVDFVESKSSCFLWCWSTGKHSLFLWYLSNQAFTSKRHFHNILISFCNLKDITETSKLIVLFWKGQVYSLGQLMWGCHNGFFNGHNPAELEPSGWQLHIKWLWKWHDARSSCHISGKTGKFRRWKCSLWNFSFDDQQM